MSTKTLSTKDGTHKWEDARAGDYLVINETRRRVGGGLSRRAISASGVELSISTWKMLGAHLERDVEEHQHGVVPEEHMLHVVFGGGGHAVNVAPGCDMGWSLYDRCSGWYWASRSSVQSLADKRGFTRLVPETEVEEAHTEGWKQGIRDTAALVARMRLEDTAQAIRAEFPDAFTQDGDGQDSSTVSVTFTKRSLCAFVECAEAAFNEAEMVDLGSGTSAWTTLLKARVTCEQDGGEQA